MLLKVRGSVPEGTVFIPGSKSHTIRALFFAALAKGDSVISKPLISDDAKSAASALRQFGASIEYRDQAYHVRGFGGVPEITCGKIDTGNSGTTMNFALSLASLGTKAAYLTGDAQVRRRPVGPLCEALKKLGANVKYLESTGCPPVEIKGRAEGGRVEIECATSQYLSSLLLTLPLLEKDSLVIPTILNEKPYAEMTLWWLEKLGIRYGRDGYSEFHIPGNQKYRGFECAIPGDFSSATFFIVLAAISGGKVTLENLRMDDPQGDKEVLRLVESMGAEVTYNEDSITVKGNELIGTDIDMNAIPDALPAFSVLGCFAKGTTRLQNVPQARLKETDRISVMCSELKKMGAKIQEHEDGMTIEQSCLRPASLNGHYDHRVVMALSLAGAMCVGETVIDEAEAVSVTFPDFAALMSGIGVDMELSDET